MILEKLVVGPFQCNCTILGCDKTREAVIIDPGDEPERILSLVAGLKLKPKYLIHTHAHLDHVSGLAGVQKGCGGESCLHRSDEVLFDNLAMQAALFGLPTPRQGKIDQWIEDGDVISFGGKKLQVLHTPGHTPGSVSFLLEQPEGDQLFTGDTLFNRSIGRTDLWGGDYGQIIASIKNKLLPLDERTVIHAGHGPNSTIGEEKAENPFLNEIF
jgi:glyoxylase-like metal-dependent hydrolase (beta-lactamase superfamily II)